MLILLRSCDDAKSHAGDVQCSFPLRHEASQHFGESRFLVVLVVVASGRGKNGLQVVLVTVGVRTLEIGTTLDAVVAHYVVVVVH